MEKTNGKKIILLLIILLLVILIIAGGAYAYIATDLFKSPDMLFKKYLVNGATQVYNFNVGPYKEAYKRMQNEQSEITIDGKYVLDNELSQYSDEDEEKQNFNTIVTLKTDNSNKNMALSFDIKQENDNYFNADIIASTDAMGIYVDGAYDKYITVENRDLKKLAEVFELEDDVIDMIPNEIPDTSFSETDREIVLNEIKTIISNELNTIDLNSYSIEKYVIDDYNGEKFEGNKYILTISSKKLDEVFSNIITNIIENEEINRVLESKFSEELINKTKEKIRDYLKEESKNIKEKTIKLSLYSYNGKTIKLDIATNDEITYELYVLNKENSSSIQMKTVLQKGGKIDVGSESLITLTSSFESENGEISYEEKTTYNKNDIKKYKAKQEKEDFWYDEEEIDELYKDKITSAKAQITSENNIITSKISITDANKKKQTATHTMKIGNIQVPTLNSKDTVVINDYTQDDFSNLTMEILTICAETAEEKPNTLIGTVFGFFNSFSNMSTSGMNDEDEFSFDNDLNNPFYIDSNDNVPSELDIFQEKNEVNVYIGNALNIQLDNYKDDAENDPNVNLGDYLTAEKIGEYAGIYIKNLEIIDGETLKCEYKENTYFVKIYIDGDTLSLQDLEVLYSEDGTLENAE